MEKDCVPLEVGSEFVYAVEMNVSLRVFKYINFRPLFPISNTVRTKPKLKTNIYKNF
jgi:hypothetical protein